ncbi:MAG TPA: hypothetical protein VFA43_04420 [Gemmatimonadaceae bacterium]|nr:hypothetical protein [Gemmatimonadaceae bacterium]
MDQTPDRAVARIILISFARGMVVLMAALAPAILLFERDFIRAHLIPVALVVLIVGPALITLALRPRSQETESCQSHTLLPSRKR